MIWYDTSVKFNKDSCNIACTERPSISPDSPLSVSRETRLVEFGLAPNPPLYSIQDHSVIEIHDIIFLHAVYVRLDIEYNDKDVNK